MRWAKGANPLFNSAKISSIADAYTLIETFTREFGQLLLQGAGGEAKRKKLAEMDIQSNERLCETRYG